MNVKIVDILLVRSISLLKHYDDGQQAETEKNVYS